jgi:hypothetical protein
MILCTVLAAIAFVVQGGDIDFIVCHIIVQPCRETAAVCRSQSHEVQSNQSINRAKRPFQRGNFLRKQSFRLLKPDIQA